MKRLKEIFLVKNNSELILHGNIFQALFLLAMPIIITNFLQHMYNLTDTYWLGKIGTAQQAAISMVSPVQNTVIAFGQGITMAGSILMSQYIGANKMKSAVHMANQIFICAMIFSFACTTGLVLFTPLITSWIGAEGEIFNLGNIYLRIVMLDTPLLFIINIFSAVNQSQGNTVFPMLLNLLGILINMVLDPLFLMVMNLGIGGVALATLLSKVPCAVVGLVYLLNKRNDIHLERRMLRPRGGMVRQILSVGLPTALGSSAMQFGFVLMSKNVYVFGSSAMAAYGIGNRINGIITLPSVAIGSATSTIVGQNLGAGQTKRAERSYQIATLTGVALLFILGRFLSYRPIASTVVGILSKDSEVMPMATDFLTIMAFWCFTNNVYNCTMNLLNASGKTKITMLVEANRMWVLRFATIFFCQRLLHMGVESIWYSVVISNGISAVILFILYLSRIWEKDTLGIRRAETKA